MTRIILASGSKYRANLLENAGVTFEQIPAAIDERSVETPLLEAEIHPADIAEILAQAKADEVSGREPGALVIGSDQTLSFEGDIMHKPADLDEAMRRLIKMSGKTHALHSSVALFQDGQMLWNHTETAEITFRDYDPGFVGRHLHAVGDVALTSVGSYQIEGQGIQLFKSMKGDFFTIMGLPLLPLLQELRNRKAMDV